MASPTLTFRAFGTPVTQGSMSARVVNGRTIVYHQRDAQLQSWRADVAEAAFLALHLAGWERNMPTLVRLDMRFLFRRPDSHYTAAGGIRAHAKAAAPGADLDKLVRAVLDALSGVLYDDDRRVVELSATKEWARSEPGAIINAERFANGTP